MTDTQKTITSIQQNPILSGIFAVVIVLTLGVAIGYSMGFDAPAKAYAQLVTVAPVTVVPVPTPVLTPPPVIVPVVTPVIPVVPVVTPPHPVDPVTVTSPSGGDHTSGNTTPGGSTTVSPVTVPAAGPVKDSDTHGPPCCTQQNPGQPTTVTPVTVPAPAPATDSDTHGPPCCTVPVTTPPVFTPPVITPTTPVIPIVPIIPTVVTPPVVPPPSGNPAECTFLTADKSVINAGEAVTLSWKTVNATGISIDNGVGPVNPVAAGTVVVHPTGNTTYKATVTGATNTVHCSAPVTIRTTPTLPKCEYLTATPEAITPGQAVTLAWKTENATSVTINNGVGAVTPVAAGTTIVHPTAATTYVATVSNAAGSVNCSAPVRITTGGGGTSGKCVQLRADKQTINSGESVVLTWATQNASKITINNGIGDVTPVQGGSITVTPTSSITYEATVPGESLQTACQVHIDVATTGCTSNCGGGGGGGGGGHHGGGGHSNKPSVSLAAGQPLASVYLSDIPYTGLDLGPVGTVVYWLTLILWSLAAAYLILFAGIPFAMRRAKSFGGNVQEALTAEQSAPSASTMTPSRHADAVYTEQLAPLHAPSIRPTPAQMFAPVAAPPAQTQLAREGFKSFATGDALTIDDIVKGLSRESGMVFSQQHLEEEAAPAPAPAPAQPAPAYEAPVAPAPAPAAPSAAPVTYSDDISGFLSALLSGDREQVFGTLRTVNRAGGDTQEFLAHAVCALDDAYRARIDGTECHPEIARITSDCGTNFLERLVSSLATAIDSSYSAGITGAKLAATRALAIVNG